jgi:ATP phosphoribosyltransferase
MRKLSLAVPNGSLQNQILAMLTLVGINIVRQERRFVFPVDHPLVGAVVFMRPQHMPRLVDEGKYDLAICGYDLYEEHRLSGSRFPLVSGKLWGSFTGSAADICPTKIVAFTHISDSIRSPADLPAQIRTITEYPGLTKSWLRRHNVHTACDYSFGSTEAHVPRDYRLGVCLTETGKTLAANKLVVIDVLLNTSPVLLASSKTVCTEQGLVFKRTLVEAGLLNGGSIEER